MPAERINQAAPEFPSAGCRRRRRGRESHRDATRAAFRRHPYRGPSRRSGQRSSRANASEAHAAREAQRAKAEGRLKFHPPSANKYCGDWSQVKFPCPANAIRPTYHRICPARIFFRRWGGIVSATAGCRRGPGRSSGPSLHFGGMAGRHVEFRAGGAGRRHLRRSRSPMRWKRSRLAGNAMF